MLDSGGDPLAVADKFRDRLYGLHVKDFVFKPDGKPEDVKPSCCSLWPLAMTDGRVKILTVHEDALDFPCNRPRRKNARGLDQGVRAILSGVYGEKVAAVVEALAEEGRRHAS